MFDGGLLSSGNRPHQTAQKCYLPSGINFYEHESLLEG